MRVAAGFAIFGLGSCVPLGVSGQTSSDSVCRSGWGTWSPLTTPDGDPVFVGQPDIVQTARGLTVWGPTVVWPAAPLIEDTAALRWARSSNAARAGAVVDLSGTARSFVPMPSGVTRMHQVRALPGTDRAAHVFWGVSDSDTASSTITSLWHARYDGDAWSPPEQALAAGRIWNGRTTVAVLEAAGVLHVAASATTHPDSVPVHDVIRYARRAGGGGWVSQSIDLGPYGARVRHVALLGPFGRDHMLIAFTGQVHPSADEIGPHGLYTVLSGDGGRTWGQPQALRPLPTTSGFLLDAARAPNGVTTLVWVTRTRPGAGTTELRQSAHLLQTADGRTWHDLPVLDLPPGVIDRMPAVAMSGELFLLGSAARERRLYLWRRRYDSAGAWAPPDTFALTSEPLWPTLSALSATELRVAWLVPHFVTLPDGRSSQVPATALAPYRNCLTKR